MNAYQQIYEFVRTIPTGKVMSYGGVARAVGYPRGAQLVGWALKALPPTTDVPWERVVNRQGILSINNQFFGKDIQAEKLRAQDVDVVEIAGVLQLPNPPWWDITL